MTKEDYLQLQSDMQQSGLSLKSYLKQIGTGHSTYNYWRSLSVLYPYNAEESDGYSVQQSAVITSNRKHRRQKSTASRMVAMLMTMRFTT